ncbi:thiazole synthase, partial [Bacillus nitratireducens]|nr:thiazole synthase [Bacillus nitratireducens]
GELLNTAVSGADDPIKKAYALKLGIEAGRLGFEAVRIARKRCATARSRLEGMSVVE